MMRICKKCVQPDTRPGIVFDDEGICLPCRTFQNASDVNWEQRTADLHKIADWGRQKNRERSSGYDCIVPVSGGKDSTRQALYARYELGLKPLLVCCSYPPEQLTERGASNLANLINLGFDTITIGPSPPVWKKLMRFAFREFGNWGKPTELALYSSAPRVAIMYNIPLIFLGENNALVYGDIGGSQDGDANRMKYNNTLSGGDPSIYLAAGVTERDLYWFRYPTDAEMESAELRIVYLGYFVKDFNNIRNAEVAICNGLQVRDDTPEDTGALANHDALDDDFVHVNQMIKYFKLGFGKATDEVCEAIRLGHMTRSEGLDLVRRIDGRCADRYIVKFCEYLEISTEEFWKIADSFRNPNTWSRNAEGNWVLDSPVWTEWQ